jgi:hypothetical protein
LAGGGTYAALVANSPLGSATQVDQFPGADFGAKLQACVSALSASYGGTCDARNFTGSLSMGSNLTISTANATVLLPCATISTASQLIVTAGTRNVALRGCALRGASTASGSQGGTVFLYSGTGAMIAVGDPTYAADTPGFHLDNVVINTTAATSGVAEALAAYRTQEMDLESLYLLGNSNQTGMTLDGTGNYTGGTFLDNEFAGFQTAVNAIGHQVSNSATTDWMNASTFIRLHIDCPTSGGSPIAGTYGINLQQGDGNTFTGGDVEGCSTALHLGASAKNNTIVGLRTENSTSQVVADAGSAYNSWMTGGTIFAGQLTDNGTRNSFLDTFHRSFNGLNGDWYQSQQDATVTNHLRLGTGAGNERGLLNEIQTDYGYRWIEGYTDATAGEQFYQVEDLLNNVNRLSIGQYNNGQSSTNNQTVINAAGTGAVVLNGSNNSGTGGVVIGSGGAVESTVATIGSTGNAQFNGTLQIGGPSTFAGSTTVRNQADAEIDQFLWAGSTKDVKESFIYKDYTGASQWYMVKDATNNWALNSALGGLDSFKAYQSTNSGDTYVNASNATGAVRINNETGAGAGFYVYGGGTTSPLYASFTGAAAIRFPGLEATSGHNCLQIDNSGYITNTGAACGTAGSSGTVNAGTAGQIAYYSGTGTAVAGESTVSIAAGGTGASTASGALSNLGGAALTGAAFTGPVSTPTTLSVANDISIGPRFDVTNSAFGAVGNGSTDDTAAIQAAFNACWNGGTGPGVPPYGGVVEFPGNRTYVISSTINAYDTCKIEGVEGGTSAQTPARINWNGPAAGTVYNLTSFTTAANISSITIVSNPASGDTVTINGTTVTFVTSGGTGNQVNIGASAAATATALYTMLNASTNTALEKSQPYTNPSSGVIGFAYQTLGYVETLSTSIPAKITVATALYAASSPKGGRAVAQPYTITFPVTNSISAGNWVILQGMTTLPGLVLNNVVAQVALATSTSFTVVVPFNPAVASGVSLGTYTDSGTATTINVAIAFDSISKFQQEVGNIMLVNASGIATNRGMGVDLYFGSRVDTGTRLSNSWIDNALYFDYYFAAGGINVAFDRGWRSDGAGLASIYWKTSATDNFGIADGTVNNGAVGGSVGAMVMLDNSSCGPNNSVRMTARNIRFETDSSYNSGLGAITMLDCPSNAGQTQFFLDFEGAYFATIYSLANAPSLVMTPANDAALSLNMSNGVLSGTATSPAVVGVPALARSNVTGSSGEIPELSYAPSLKSAGLSASAWEAHQLIGDVNIGQLWQYGTQASDFLYTDTAFAALPNATTLFAGQTIAPPGYWSGVNGKRYALDVVYQTGTTGSPNAGATTCTGTAGTNVLTCTSATDLSAGQRITIGTDTNKVINYVDATLPGAVLVNLGSNLGANYSTATALTFSAPLLGPEMQLPTKSSAAPTTLAWSQGDFEQNSGATANGIAGWVNVAGGSPGTWAGIPLGNAAGQIAASQVAPASLQGTDSKLLTAGTVSGTASPLCTDANGGATTAGCPNSGVLTNTPAWLQYLATGADGSYEASPTATCSTSPSTCAINCTAASPCVIYGEKYYSSFTIDSGAVVRSNSYSSGTVAGLVVHATGACTINGSILVNWTFSSWPATYKGMFGGASGGSGGGTAAGVAGDASYLNASGSGYLGTGGGTLGAASGGNGGNGGSYSVSQQRGALNGSIGGTDGAAITGSTGVQGGNTGGTGGNPGSGFLAMCGSINGTGGLIDASGGAGNPPSANSTGAGSGGGGGVVVLSSQAAVSTWPTIDVAGGPGGLVTVPEAAATSGTCTSQPKATLGVTSGALNGTCTVVQAGAGCGTGANVAWNVLGGGGTLGTATINPIWSSGSLASCTVTPGTSSGYTAATYTTSGTGGDGGAGWYAEFQGW